MTIVWIILGMVIGCPLGILLLALMCAGKLDDELYMKYKEKEDDLKDE